MPTTVLLGPILFLVSVLFVTPARAHEIDDPGAHAVPGGSVELLGAPADLGKAIAPSAASAAPSTDPVIDEEVLAESYKDVLETGAEILREPNILLDWAKRIFLLMLIISFQYLFFLWLNRLFRRSRVRIIDWGRSAIKPIKIRDYECLSSHRQVGVLVAGASLLRYAILALQLTLTVPLLFALFPHTRELAYELLGYMVLPIKTIGWSIIHYIPNLAFIVIIGLCGRYLLKGLKYLAQEISSERLKIPGFYPDWAAPTHNIVRLLVYAFMVAMIYPYLPGAKSGVFQGISIFVGLILSLGSSTVISNIIAGMVITYMRPFRVGDRIKLNETVGNVLEKTTLVTRIRTLKNEVVTIPNSFIMSSQTINYTTSAQDFGLIIHTKVSVGYDTDWRLVHALLIESAQKTDGIDRTQEPFVLETSLDDFYPVYQINAYIKDANRLSQIYSGLHQSIQDTFQAAGVKIESPTLVMMRSPEQASPVVPRTAPALDQLFGPLSASGADRIEDREANAPRGPGPIWSR